MRDALEAAIAAIDRGEAVVLVEVVEALGSTPREAGAVMLVGEDLVVGTIGGGELERRAIERARERLENGTGIERLDLPLGPALAQCCGGYVTLGLTMLGPAARPDLEARIESLRAALPRVVLFGAGHVGRALVRALAPLPCRVLWVDARQDIFPPDLAADTATLTPADPASVPTLPQDLVLIMTHSHALDLAIVEAVLRRERFAWLGLIGSATKRRRFEHQLRARGIPPERLERIVCPIGIAGIDGKEPAVIAAAVAAQILAVSEALARRRTLASVA